MTGTAGSYNPPQATLEQPYVYAVLPGNFDVKAAAAENAWVDIGLQVTLPIEGNYEVSGQIRTYYQISNADTHLGVRAFDVTANAVVPNFGTKRSSIYGGNDELPLLFLYRNSGGPKTIKLQTRWSSNGTPGQITIYSDADGTTDILAKRLGPYVP